MSQAEPSGPPPRRPFQFGLSTLLLIMFLFSILAAALSGMLNRGAGKPTMPAGFYVMMAVAAPMAAMIAISLIRALRRWLKKRD